MEEVQICPFSSMARGADAIWVLPEKLARIWDSTVLEGAIWSNKIKPGLLTQRFHATLRAPFYFLLGLNKCQYSP